MGNSYQSLERIYPATENADIAGSETLELHLERYRFAAQHVVPGEILDIACGSGYGSYLLATSSTFGVTGVDIDPEAITYARLHYQHPAVQFKVSDAMNFTPETSYYNIISLETIEHLPEPGAFVKKIASVLPVGGRFIASAPVTPSMDANPFHLSDFTVQTFSKHFSDCGLVEVARMTQVQKFKPAKLIDKSDNRSKGIRKNLLRYYLSHPGKAWLRLKSLIKHGFTNKYVVIAFEKRNSIH